MKSSSFFNKFLGLLSILSGYACSQSPNKSLDTILSQLNDDTVPYLSTQELEQNYDQYLILDTRKKEEYEVSHLANSIWIGDKNIDWEKVRKQINDPDQQIVVYCSIGVRSEDVGEQLLKNNFSKVFNLYGGIFKWVNEGKKVVNDQQEPTNNIHPYNSFWGKLLTQGQQVIPE